MKMMNIDMEFVTFDAQDVIATSGGLTYLYASQSANVVKPAGIALPGIDFTLTALPDPSATDTQLSWTAAATNFGSAITGFQTTLGGLLFSYTTIDAKSDATGIDVTDPKNGFMTDNTVDLSLIFDWLNSATDGHRVQ